MRNRLIKTVFIAMLLCSVSCGTSVPPANKAATPEPAPNITRTTIVYSDDYDADLGGLESFHSFDIHKYKRIHDQLVKEKLLNADQVLAPEVISKEDLLRIHSEGYLENLKSPQKLVVYLETPVVGFVPADLIGQFVLKPFRSATGGTLLAARKVMETGGVAVNFGGGYHHAKPDKGEGFCLYADMPIAIRVLQAEEKIKTALIIDLDAHQGNGTIVSLGDDETTYCFSLHQGNIYPNPKEQGDWNIELEAGTGDDEYLQIVDGVLAKVYESAGKPDIVFYQAGCDTLKSDPLTSLSMTEEGIVQRDLKVIDACVKQNVPVVMTLGGGYSPNAWHAQYASVRNILKKYPQAEQSAN